MSIADPEGTTQFEEYANRRITAFKTGLRTGLDLHGCRLACWIQGSQCRAFTFGWGKHPTECYFHDRGVEAAELINRFERNTKYNVYMRRL